MARKPEAKQEFLMNLQAGTLDTVPYTFSEPRLDLAIISLDQRHPEFADELHQRGYVPVGLEDISNEPSAEGAEIFTVGFPQATAVLGERQLHPAEANWSSRYVSLPAFSFGKVSMLHPDLSFFWCDISAYPGNSGGPVIEGNKLVGIVSAQAIHEGSRIPFAKIIKASHIRSVLNVQFKKDQRWDAMHH